MYVNGTYDGDGSASNNFSYTFTGLSQGTTYTLSVQWFSSGDTLVGSNSTTGTTLVNDTIDPVLDSYTVTPTIGGVDVTWNAHDSGGSGFGELQLYRSAPGVDSGFTSVLLSFVEDGSYSLSGWDEGTLYYFYWYLEDNNNNTYTSSHFSRTTLVGPTPAPSAPVITSRFDQGFSVSWGSVSGATDYDLEYRPSGIGSYNSINKTTTSHTFNFPGSYGVPYDLRVRASRDGGATWSPYSGINIGTTTPKTPTIDGEYSAGVVSITISGMVPNYDAIVVERRLQSNGSFVDSKSTASGTGTVTWGIATNVELYYFRAYSTIGSLSSVSYSNIVEFVRPEDWEWWLPKISGQPFNITADEWNDFTSRIDAFLVYQGLSEWGFIQYATDDGFTDGVFNTARSAIAAMNPPLALPAPIPPGNEFIYAGDINGLRDSLNSIP